MHPDTATMLGQHVLRKELKDGNIIRLDGAEDFYKVGAGQLLKILSATILTAVQYGAANPQIGAK